MQSWEDEFNLHPDIAWLELIYILSPLLSKLRAAESLCAGELQYFWLFSMVLWLLLYSEVCIAGGRSSGHLNAEQPHCSISGASAPTSDADSHPTINTYEFTSPGATQPGFSTTSADAAQSSAAQTCAKLSTGAFLRSRHPMRH